MLVQGCTLLFVVKNPVYRERAQLLSDCYVTFLKNLDSRQPHRFVQLLPISWNFDNDSLPLLLSQHVCREFVAALLASRRFLASTFIRRFLGKRQLAKAASLMWYFLGEHSAVGIDAGSAFLSFALLLNDVS